MRTPRNNTYISCTRAVCDDNTPLVNELAEYLSASVEWLKANDAGCCMYRIDDRLGIAVGWLDLGEPADVEEQNKYFVSPSQPNYIIAAGVKVYTSDDLGTDYDWYAAPYDKNGEVYDEEVFIPHSKTFIKTDYLAIARNLLKSYQKLEKYALRKDGLILGEKVNCN